MNSELLAAAIAAGEMHMDPLSPDLGIPECIPRMHRHVRLQFVSDVPNRGRSQMFSHDALPPSQGQIAKQVWKCRKQRRAKAGTQAQIGTAQALPQRSRLLAWRVMEFHRLARHHFS